MNYCISFTFPTSYVKEAESMTLGYIGKCSLPMHSAHSAKYTVHIYRKSKEITIALLALPCPLERTESREGTDNMEMK